MATLKIAQDSERSLARRKLRSRKMFVAWLRLVATNVENGTYTVRDAVRVARAHFSSMGSK